MYSDFSKIIKEPESKYQDKDFWDWLDLQLAEHRAEYNDITDDTERAVKSKGWAHTSLRNTHFWLTDWIPSNLRVFECALLEHENKFIPKAKPKLARPLPWQRSVAQSVIEIDAYTPDDLAESASVDEESLNTDGDAQEQELAQQGEPDK